MQRKPTKEPRSIKLQGREIAFLLKRFRGRSNVGLIIDHRGLTVTAPRHASDSFVFSAIETQADWVLDRLERWKDRRPGVPEWHDGCVVPFLGEPVSLMRDLFHRGAPRLEEGVLWLEPGLDDLAVREQVVTWYRAQAQQYFPPRVEKIAAAFSAKPARVLVSDADSRWGSCNVKGEVRLTWRLMKAPPRVIDYVIAHELAHLKHMDHSAAFWRTVEKLYPGYRPAKHLLRKNDVLYRGF